MENAEPYVTESTEEPGVKREPKRTLRYAAAASIQRGPTGMLFFSFFEKNGVTWRSLEIPDGIYISCYIFN